MISLPGNPQSEKAEDQWRHQLADFAKTNQKELAALSWGLWLENQHNDSAIGIDLEPTPHFIYCPKSAFVKLNENVGDRLQEILGIVEGFNPEKEVLIVGLNKGQIKLIEFETQPPPPECFELVATDVNGLLDRLENRLSDTMKP